MHQGRKIALSRGFYIDPQTSEADAPDYVEFLNDPDIYAQTLAIPYPYSMEDALKYIRFCEQQRESTGREMNFHVRDEDGHVCGNFGIFAKYGLSSHRDEIGYCIGRKYWNIGLMTEVLQTLCPLLQDEYGLTRLEAVVFDFNHASGRVLEKSGFSYEGTLKKAYFKDGKFIDGKLYALVK